jgi:hypothetical protein
MLVLEDNLVIVVEVPGEGGQPERGEERVLDGAEERALRLGERGKDQLDAPRAR